MSICGVLDGELSSRFLRHLLIQMTSDSTVVHPALMTLAAPAAPAVGYTASTAGYTALVASCSALAPAVSYAARTPAVFYAVPALRNACSACCELHRACCQLHRPAPTFRERMASDVSGTARSLPLRTRHPRCISGDGQDKDSEKGVPVIGVDDVL